MPDEAGETKVWFVTERKPKPVQRMCEVLKHNYIFSIDNFFTEDECHALIQQSRKKGFIHTNGDDVTMDWRDEELAQTVVFFDIF